MNKFLVAMVLVVGAACGPTGGATSGCTDDASCGPRERCLYKMADGCDAVGECVPEPTGPQCFAIRLSCGCGTNATSGCGFPEGYASAPTTGAICP